MKKSLLILLTGLFFLFSTNVSAQESRFYLLNLISSQEKLELKDITVLPGAISTVLREGDYRYDLLSLTGLSLHSDHFNIPPSTRSIRIFDPETGESTSKIVKEESISITLAIPYFPNGKEVNIYDVKNVKILTIPVQQFSPITPSPISTTAPIEANKPDKGMNTLWIIGGSILIIVLGIILAFYFYFKKPQPPVQ